MSANTGECDRRGCEVDAVFLVRERYPEETDKGIVEAKAQLCHDHTREERPTNLAAKTPEYLFEVTPLDTTDSA